MYAYEELGWLDTNPLLKRVKEDPRSHKYFTQQQIKKLIEVLPNISKSLSYFPS